MIRDQTVRDITRHAGERVLRVIEDATDLIDTLDQRAELVDQIMFALFGAAVRLRQRQVLDQCNEVASDERMARFLAGQLCEAIKQHPPAPLSRSGAEVAPCSRAPV